MLEERQIEDRRAKHFEGGIEIGDRGGRLVMDHALGGDTPERRLARLVLTGRELAVLEFGDIAIAPNGTPRRDA